MKKSKIESSAIAKTSKTQTVLSGMSTVAIALFAMVFMLKSGMAHPGHDHAASESVLVHTLFYGSIGVVIAVGVWFAYLCFKKQNNK